MEDHSSLQKSLLALKQVKISQLLIYHKITVEVRYVVPTSPKKIKLFSIHLHFISCFRNTVQSHSTLFNIYFLNILLFV